MRFFFFTTFLLFTYLLFTSQLTPTALKHFHSSSSHCYGEHDCSSPTPHIFVLELTSLGMANITFRPQEQDVLNCTLQSYAAMPFKMLKLLSSHYRYCSCTHLWNFNSEFSSHITAPCVICYELHYSNICFVYWVTWQASFRRFIQHCFLFSCICMLPSVPLQYDFIILFFTHMDMYCMFPWNFLYIAAYIDRIITLLTVKGVIFLINLLDPNIWSSSWAVGLPACQRGRVRASSNLYAWFDQVSAFCITVKLIYNVFRINKLN